MSASIIVTNQLLTLQIPVKPPEGGSIKFGPSTAIPVSEIELVDCKDGYFRLRRMDPDSKDVVEVTGGFPAS